MMHVSVMHVELPICDVAYLTIATGETGVSASNMDHTGHESTTEAPDWDCFSDPQSPMDGPVFESADEQSPKGLSAEARERYNSFVRARRASRSKLRILRSGSKEEEEDDGSVPTFCPHCNKEYRQNNR